MTPLHSMIRFGVTTAALAVGLSAQAASYTFFGSASGETSYGQALTVTGLPQLGTTFSVAVDYTPAPISCTLAITPWAMWLLTGFSKQTWSGVPLPAQLPQGFTLLVSPDAVTTMNVMSNSGCAPGWPSNASPSFDITVPNTSNLVGVQLHQQILLSRLQQGQVFVPPLATNGGTLTVGL